MPEPSEHKHVTEDEIYAYYENRPSDGPIPDNVHFEGDDVMDRVHECDEDDTKGRGVSVCLQTWRAYNGM